MEAAAAQKSACLTPHRSRYWRIANLLRLHRFGQGVAVESTHLQDSNAHSAEAKPFLDLERESAKWRRGLLSIRLERRCRVLVDRGGQSKAYFLVQRQLERVLFRLLSLL